MVLVSVIVVTYNSSSFVLETLNSVYRQTWDNLELIIADDCSADDTVDVCRNWLNKNSSRFASAELIDSEKNLGIPGNLNRGLKRAKGDWIKFFAGDDTLKPDCIADNMTWISENPQTRILFSNVEIYKDSFEPGKLITSTPGNSITKGFILDPDRSAQSQYRMLLVCDRIHFTPSAFFHTETLISIGGYDERFRMQEDYPMWLKLTGKGIRLSFMNKTTVNYRQHSAAVNNTGENWLINPNYFKTEYFRRIYTYPYLPLDVRLNQRYTWLVSLIFRNKLLNIDRTFNRFLYSLVSLYLNPFKYLIFMRKLLYRNLRNNEFYH